MSLSGGSGRSRMNPSSIARVITSPPPMQTVLPRSPPAPHRPCYPESTEEKGEGHFPITFRVFFMRAGAPILVGILASISAS